MSYSLFIIALFSLLHYFPHDYLACIACLQFVCVCVGVDRSVIILNRGVFVLVISNINSVSHNSPTAASCD